MTLYFVQIMVTTFLVLMHLAPERIYVLLRHCNWVWRGLGIHGVL